MFTSSALYCELKRPYFPTTLILFFGGKKREITHKSSDEKVLKLLNTERLEMLLSSPPSNSSSLSLAFPHFLPTNAYFLIPPTVLILYHYLTKWLFPHLGSLWCCCTVHLKWGSLEEPEPGSDVGKKLVGGAWGY